MNGKIFTGQYRVDKYEESYLHDAEVLHRVKYTLVKDLINAIMGDPEFGSIIQHDDTNTDIKIYKMELAVMPLDDYKKLVKILGKADIIIFDEVTNTHIHLRDLI